MITGQVSEHLINLKGLVTFKRGKNPIKNNTIIYLETKVETVLIYHTSYKIGVFFVTTATTTIEKIRKIVSSNIGWDSYDLQCSVIGFPPRYAWSNFLYYYYIYITRCFLVWRKGPEGLCRKELE